MYTASHIHNSTWPPCPIAWVVFWPARVLRCCGDGRRRRRLVCRDDRWRMNIRTQIQKLIAKSTKTFFGRWSLSICVTVGWARESLHRRKGKRWWPRSWRVPLRCSAARMRLRSAAFAIGPCKDTGWDSRRTRDPARAATLGRSFN